MNTHFVNRVVLDFSFPNGEKNLALSKTKTLFYDKALSLINYNFDKIEPRLYIKHLEIDLGETTEENFQQDLFKAIGVALEPYLQGRRSSQQEIGEEPDLLADGELHQFMHFLRKGYWPWVIQQKNEAQFKEFVHAALEKKQLLFDLFQKLHTERSSYAERLIQLAFLQIRNTRSLLFALKGFHPALSGLSNVFDTQWQKKLGDQQEIYFLSTRELIISSPIETAQQLRIFLVGLSVMIKNERSPDLSWKRKNQSIKAINAWIDEIKDAISHDVAEDTTLGVDDRFIAVVADEQDVPVADKLRDEEKEKINISNAGLILFHPYLNLVFAELGWINAQHKFASEKKRQKAILFLQYLISGRSRHAEHELVLNKIICSYPVNMPVATSCNFSKKEKAAAQDIVESLKEHWAVMKNTSVKGMIESFINRPGLLQETENGWLLQIERRSIDLLLDSLPFGFNIIKFPWNEQIIHTEW